MIQEYKVITGDTAGELEREVQELLQAGEGWDLQGGISCSVYSYEGDHGWDTASIYAQALTRMINK